jgi:hypothetical protein
MGKDRSATNNSEKNSEFLKVRVEIAGFCPQLAIAPNRTVNNSELTVKRKGSFRHGRRVGPA